jgi:hypothetical protein
VKLAAARASPRGALPGSVVPVPTVGGVGTAQIIPRERPPRAIAPGRRNLPGLELAPGRAATPLTSREQSCGTYLELA